MIDGSREEGGIHFNSLSLPSWLNGRDSSLGSGPAAQQDSVGDSHVEHRLGWAQMDDKGYKSHRGNEAIS